MSARCRLGVNTAPLVGVVDTAVLGSAVRQHSQKPKAMLLEERQNPVVQQVRRRQRRFVRVHFREAYVRVRVDGGWPIRMSSESGVFA